LIEIEERQPFALWQCDGKVLIVAADGVPVAAMRDHDSFIGRSLWVLGPMRNSANIWLSSIRREICENGSWRECSSRSAAGR